MLPDDQINQVPGNNNVDDIPNNPPDCNLEERLEEDCQDDKQNHSIRCTIFILAICEVSKNGHSKEPNELVIPIRHRE